MTDRVLKWSIPVDDKPHDAPALVVHVACQSSYDSVEVWALERHIKYAGIGKFQVFATGQEVPDDAEYVGTALAAQGSLVWHLFNVTKVVK